MTTQQLLSGLRKGVTEYKMIKDGDKIAVGVSGGKDSVTLLKLLAEYRKFSPENFQIIAITIDLRFDGKNSDYSEIENLCKELNVEYFIERTDIGQIVFSERKETNPCSLCSKMRKGALYEVAKKQGCNKVALGHHKDDLIDTFALSLFYEGRLSTFAPKSYLDRTGITLIRPMLFIEEYKIESYSKTLPVLESKCPANKNTKRELVKTIIKNIGENIPDIREMMFTAIIHPDRYNLFDKFLLQNDNI